MVESIVVSTIPHESNGIESRSSHMPPMLGMLNEFVNPAEKLGLELVPAQVTQTLSETELIDLLPQFDGWIIGDDPQLNKCLAGKKDD